MWEQHLEGNQPYLLNWLAHQTDGEYWRNGSLRAAYDRDPLPRLHDRGLAGRLPQPAPAHLRRPPGAEEGAHRPLEPLPAGRGTSRPPHRLGGARCGAGATTGSRGRPTASRTTRRSPSTCSGYDAPRADRLDTSGYWRVEPALPLPGRHRAGAAPPPRRAARADRAARSTTAGDEPARATSSPTARPRHRRRAVERGRALRAAHRPAPGRDRRPDLHHRAARGAAGDRRLAPGRAARQLDARR